MKKAGALALSAFGVIGILCPMSMRQTTFSARRIFLLTAEEREILGHMSIVQMDDGQGGYVKTIQISGVNLQVVNGLGSSPTINGSGNLVVGYNELGNPNGDNRTGSHNIIGGTEARYTSYCGLVMGNENTISAPWATVTGGAVNSASGLASSVTAGIDNIASAVLSSVTGGGSNEATSDRATVSGGLNNIASGDFSSISGGNFNLASGAYSSVAGGAQNEASGQWSSVSGGQSNLAGGGANAYSWVGGGQLNKATSNYACVSGGHNNEAGGALSLVCGGDGHMVNGQYDWQGASCNFCTN